jgi:hypothetical protein
MRSLPTILLVLALPAGAIGYFVGARVLEAVLPEGLQGLVPFAALLIAGLAMLPFLIPFVDRKAKQDLAAYRATKGEDSDPDGDQTPPVHEVDR